MRMAILGASLSLSCLAPRENAIPECATTVSVSVLPACGAKQQVDPPLVAHPASSRTQSPKQIVDLRPCIQFYKSLIRPCVIYRTHPLPRQSTHPPRTQTHTDMRAHVAQGIPRAPHPYTTHVRTRLAFVRYHEAVSSPWVSNCASAHYREYITISIPHLIFGGEKGEV
jgi:hypothetical protein